MAEWSGIDGTVRRYSKRTGRGSIRLVDGRVVMFTDRVVKQSGIRDLQPRDDVTVILKQTLQRASAAQIRLREEPVTARELRERIVTVEDELAHTLDRPINVLLVGRTGVGKSSTINKLLGVEWATVGDHEPETAEIHCYEGTIGGAEVRVIDTPGFCDDHPDKGNDSRYLREMVKTVEKIDLALFVTILDDTRVRGDEIHALKLLTKSFGEELWQKAVVVFTRADRFRAPEYKEKRDGRFAAFLRRLREIVPEAGTVPFVPVSNQRPRTPDRRLWLPVLWIACLERMSGDGFEPFFLATATRLEGPAPKKAEKQRPNRPPAGAKHGMATPVRHSQDGDGQQKKQVAKAPSPASSHHAPTHQTRSTSSEPRAQRGMSSRGVAGGVPASPPPASSTGEGSEANRRNAAAAPQAPAMQAAPRAQISSRPAPVEVTDSDPPRQAVVEKLSEQRQNGVRVVTTKFSSAQGGGTISIVGDNSQVLQTVIERRAPSLLRRLAKIGTSFLPEAVRRLLGL